MLPADPVARARTACEALTLSGFDAALALEVPDDGSEPVVCAASGRSEPLLDDVQRLAIETARTGMALHMPQARLGGRRCAAITAGDVLGGRIVLVFADGDLARRECEAVAAWMAPSMTSHAVLGGSCGPLARSLAHEFSAEVVVVSLFSTAGMLCNLHVRSGGLLRTWRIPSDTVWGEAARHAAAFMLGELHLHPGAEPLASMGMQSASVVGLENGHGVAIGSIGIASREDLDLDVAHALLERAPTLGPAIMQLRSRTAVPVPDESGSVDVSEFAARVGCRRFAMYVRDGSVLRLSAAHDIDGNRLISPPDSYEEQLVCWAAEKGIAVVSEDAAAVLVGDDTVLYAQDPLRNPMECLRCALQDLRDNPYGDSLAA